MAATGAVSLFKQPVSVSECNDTVDKMMRMKPRIRRLASGKLFDISSLELTLYSNEELFQTELASIAESLTEVTKVAEAINIGKIDEENERKEEALRKEMYRRIRMYKFSRTIHANRLKKTLTPIEIQIPYPSRDIVVRNIRELPTLNSQTVLLHRQEVFRKRDESLIAARDRHQQIVFSLEHQEPDLVRKSFKTITDASGNTRPKLELLISTGLAGLFSSIANTVLLKHRSADLSSSDGIATEGKAALRIPVHVILFLQAMVRSFRRRLHARKGAQKIWTLLNAWKSAGLIILAMNRFHVRVTHAQRILKNGLNNMAAVTRAVSERWVVIEREMIATELASGTGSNSVAIAKRGHLTTIPDATRIDYVKANLRYLRRKWAEDYIAWRLEMHAYDKLLSEWRYSRVAIASLGGRQTAPPPKHPAYPVFTPDDEEVAVMIAQCRKGVKPVLPKRKSKYHM